MQIKTVKGDHEDVREDRAFQAEDIASTKLWSKSELGALEKKLGALILLQSNEKN